MNIDKGKTTIILGPPGTGKTTKLLEIAEGLFSVQVDPRKVCFASFTKRAASEARERAKARFYFTDVQLHLFRTLHSLAFEYSGVKAQNVVTYLDYSTVARTIGETITAQRKNEDGTMSNQVTMGDKMFHLEALARARNVPLEKVWKENVNDDIDFSLLTELAANWKRYKSNVGKVDFTDILNKFIEAGTFEPLEALFIDEAQDLSHVQWRMVELLAKNAKRVFIAGDDDQAIYTWAGADVAQFISLQGKQEVLKQSYRVPKQVHNVAKTIAGKINYRRKKEFAARTGDEQGSVQLVGSLSDLDMSTGTWLLLCRNIGFMQEFIEYCKERCLMFECRHTELVSGEMIEAIRDWELLRNGSKITVDRAKNVYEHMRVKVNFKWGGRTKLDLVKDNELIDLVQLQKNFGLRSTGTWDTALGKIPSTSKEYMQAASSRGENLDKPRIRISTIHSIKGAEADNVVLCTDISQRTMIEFEHDSRKDDEWRVWYVAVTRAKQNLHILSPRTLKFVEFSDWLQQS